MKSTLSITIILIRAFSFANIQFLYTLNNVYYLLKL